MNKSLKLFSLVAICLSILFVSCSKNITCNDGVIAIYPVGFTKTDFDSAIVYRYKQDNAFDIIIDSTHFVYYTNGDYDTASLSVMSQYGNSGLGSSFLLPGYDYKIHLPKAGRTFAITNIVQKGNKTQSYTPGLFENGTVVSCCNTIISCNLDGKLIYVTTNTLQSSKVNIVK